MHLFIPMLHKKKDNKLMEILRVDPRCKVYVDKHYILPKRINNLITNLKGYKESTVFLNKVTRKEAPDYHTIIKNPMDFSTIQKKSSKYSNYEEFKSDLDLMWSNCFKYNAGPYYIHCATTMKGAVESQEIERVPVSMDKDFKPETVSIEGILNYRPIVRRVLKGILVRIIKECGYESCSSMALEILCDVLSFKLESQ